MCVPCSFQHINVKATHICKICKNPEPLCENCSDHHTLQKLTRNHQMCEDIQQFLKPELNAWYEIIVLKYLFQDKPLWKMHFCRPNFSIYIIYKHFQEKQYINFSQLWGLLLNVHVIYPLQVTFIFVLNLHLSAIS